MRWCVYWLLCHRLRKALKLMPASDIDYSINISPRYRYVYVDNPKTGCSSLKSAMVEMESRDTEAEVDYYDSRIIHNRGKSPLRRITELPLGAPFGYLYMSGYKFVTFVRNPYTRLLSCYRDKILNNEPLKATVLGLLGESGQPIETPLTFEDFVRAIFQQSDYEMNSHWRPQTAQICYGILEYTYIGRFEQYEDDFSELFAQLGIPADKTPSARHLNRTREGASEGCAKYYTAELQDMVYRRYQNDFDNFGYPYELPG